MNLKHTLFATGLLSTLVSIIPLTANAETTGYNQISFIAEAKQEVNNDEVRASLYKKIQTDDAKSLAVELNTAMNNAIRLAKKYPNVTVTTGQQNTYPKYDKNNKIVGWTGRAGVDIKSTNLSSASQLISELQENLVMDSLVFGVSEKRQDKVRQELLQKVSTKFQQQATMLTSSWGARDYRVIKVDLNTGSNYYSRPMMADTGFSVMKANVPNQDFESGSSSISVTANGTIELVK